MTKSERKSTHDEEMARLNRAQAELAAEKKQMLKFDLLAAGCGTEIIPRRNLTKRRKL